MNASQLTNGQAAIVTDVEPNAMQSKLISLGVRRGATIQLIRKTSSKGLLFRIEDHRAVIHNSIAKHISVVGSN